MNTDSKLKRYIVLLDKAPFVLFLESANEMTKIYESLGILQDHFNFNDRENKYDELKEYFLKYLNDYVRKLDHIFAQKKMTKDDIDNLNK